jgi:hypothetical protein
VPLDPDAVGWESKPRETSWRSEDCLLYALGVGAGPADLAYVTENSIGVEQRALPTMAVVLGQFDDEVWQAFGTFPWAMMVHGGQEFVWGEPVCSGDVITTVNEFKDYSEKDGKQFFVFESVSTNQDGQEVCRGTWTNIVRGG